MIAARTLPPIGKDSSVTVGLMFIVMGGVLWLSTMFTQGAANAEIIKENKKKIAKVEENQVELLKLINNQQLIMQENHINIEFIKKAVENIQKKVNP